MLRSAPVEEFTEDFGDRIAERVTAERLRPRLVAVLDGLPARDRELLLIAWVNPGHAGGMTCGRSG
jgi:hypothetical protein